MSTCVQCQAEFVPNASRVQRFCTRYCKERAAADRRREPIRVERAAQREHAARELLEKLRLAPAPEARTCALCGTSLDRQQKYCSGACAIEAKRQYDRAYNQTRLRRPMECESDGCDQLVTGHRRKCDQCMGSVRKERKRRERRRRRNALRGTPSEPYTLAEIAARDRNTCGLCRKRVAMTKAVPHPKAPTIDHVVPISDGGHDVKANIQLAHFECNWRKRAGGTQQLALFG